MTSLTLAADTNSAPFVDYKNDVIYVGDDLGVLHKFQNVFLSGTPAPVVGGGWPATVHAASKLTSPVFDSASTLVFVGDSAGLLSSVTTTGTQGTVVSSASVTAGAAGTVTAVGGRSTTLPLFAGAFDNIYFSSGNAASPTGHLYVCGYTGTSNGNAVLNQITITGNVMSATATATDLSTANAACSPVTKILGLLHFEWVKNAWSRGAKPRGTRVWELC
jgi:hypothetical protein